MAVPDALVPGRRRSRRSTRRVDWGSRFWALDWRRRVKNRNDRRRTPFWIYFRGWLILEREIRSVFFYFSICIRYGESRKFYSHYFSYSDVHLSDEKKIDLEISGFIIGFFWFFLGIRRGTWRIITGKIVQSWFSFLSKCRLSQPWLHYNKLEVNAMIDGTSSLFLQPQ